MLGGMGLLGAEVVRRLEAHGVTVTAASRRTGVDLATGAGLESALQRVDCGSMLPSILRHRTVNFDGTRRMIKILVDRATPPHVITTSIVG